MQSQNVNLTQLLFALFEGKDNIRVPAEKELQNLCINNYGPFLFELSKKFQDEKEECTVRQLSATIIKNKIIEYKDKWFNLDENIKEQIKNNILASLITPDINVKKAAAFTIAGICRVELPKNIWTNIFDTLINASQNNNIDVKITSLITLGYIFEEFTVNSIHLNINNDTITKLLNMYYSILSNSSQNGGDNIPLILSCLNSIRYFVPYFEVIISDNSSRLIFFNLIKDYMLNADEKIRQYGIIIFAELIEHYYKYFQNYIDILMQNLFQIIDKDSENNKMSCLEVLCTIGEKEINLINTAYNVTSNFYFLNKYKQQISQIVLKFIITNKFDDEDYSLSKYCRLLIIYMSLCCDFSFTEEMLNYYLKNISSNDAIIKFSALNVFNSILESKDKNKIFPIIQNSLPMLSSILIDNQTILFVRKLIAKIMKKISKNFGFLIKNDPDLFGKFMTLFYNLLKDNPPEIVFTILESVNELVKQIETNEYLDKNILGSYAKTYFDILLKLSQEISLFNPDNNVPMVALFTIGSFGGHVANDVNNEAYNVFKLLLEMFSNTFKINLFENQHIRLNYQEYICMSLDNFLRNNKALEKDVRNLFSLIMQSFQQRQEIYEEGISLVGSISSYLQGGFMKEMSTFNSYLLHGLNSTDSYGICKTSLSTLDEIIMYSGADFNMYVEKYLKIILHILSDNTINRELKPKSFGIISQLFLSCPQEVFKQNYYNEIMAMVGGAFEACKMDFGQEKDNVDFINYIIELKESILEAMTCIFKAVEDRGDLQLFIPYATKTVEFINFILRDEAQLNNEIIRNSLALIANFCEDYGKNIKVILNIDLLKDTIEKWKNKMEEQDANIIAWIQKSITNVVISN